MQKEIVTLLAKYNKSVNQKMNDSIKELSAAEWDKPLGGYFSSVHSQCSHLYICDFNWLKRFKNLRSFATLNDSFFDTNYSFSETIFASLSEYLAKRPDLDERMLSFANELTDADLASTFTFTDSHGKPHERNLGGCVLQFLNHDTHHRGSISVYLDMLGKENDFSSFAQVL